MQDTQRTNWDKLASSAAPVREPETCKPDCDGRKCGADGCGGSCGACPTAQTCDVESGACERQACVVRCAQRECGDDGCGSSCGECAADAACGAEGRCVALARCGNGRKETGEQCDGGANCNAACEIVEPPPAPVPTPPMPQSNRAQCMSSVAIDAGAECQKCVCNRCTELAIACYASPDADRNERCTALAECGQRHDCRDQSCFCGDSFLCLSPNGACRAQAELASGTNNLVEVHACYADPSCAAYRARTLGECVEQECRDSCAR